jgi:hypothetical protein
MMQDCHCNKLPVVVSWGLAQHPESRAGVARSDGGGQRFRPAGSDLEPAGGPVLLCVLRLCVRASRWPRFSTPSSAGNTRFPQVAGTARPARLAAGKRRAAAASTIIGHTSWYFRSVPPDQKVILFAFRGTWATRPRTAKACVLLRVVGRTAYHSCCRLGEERTCRDVWMLLIFRANALTTRSDTMARNTFCSRQTMQFEDVRKCTLAPSQAQSRTRMHSLAQTLPAHAHMPKHGRAIAPTYSRTRAGSQARR